MVLTHSHWLAEYGGNPEVLGREITIDDQAYEVIGVAPRVFEAFDARVKFVLPLSWPPAAENPAARYGVGIQLFGRLTPGVLAGQADAEAKAELAIRSALGASRLTIARQLMLESLLLTSIGALLGVGLAWAALRVTNTYLASLLPQALPAVLDLRVLGFAVVVTVIVGVLIGLVPVWHVLRTNLVAIMQQGTRGSSSGRGVRALSRVLVVAQVGVALVLLTGAGLLIQSFARARVAAPT